MPPGCRNSGGKEGSEMGQQSSYLSRGPPGPSPPPAPNTPYPTSEAMSSSPRHCRSFSFWTRVHISGSLSARLSCPVQPGTCPVAAAAAVPCCARWLPLASQPPHRRRACAGDGGLTGCDPTQAGTRAPYPEAPLQQQGTAPGARLRCSVSSHRCHLSGWAQGDP